VAGVLSGELGQLRGGGRVPAVGQPAQLVDVAAFGREFDEFET
jgi:hypothetical protein